MYRPNARSPSITSQESYSAVMITDLVADVPVTPETEAPKTTKEATNLAYDGHLDGITATPPATDDPNQKANGAGQISKGVLLNAVQFGQNDAKGKSDEKSVRMVAALPIPTLAQQAAETKGFKDMSLPRKIAFAFSFLPSVLFVLCFAVILPCNVPPQCIDTIWSRMFNHTEATSVLEIADDIVFTALKHGESVFVQLDKAEGNFTDVKIPVQFSHLKCGRIMNKENTDCFVLGENGTMYSFDDSKSVWNSVMEGDEYTSNPVILPGCTDDEKDAVVVAVSNSEMKVLYSGNKMFTFNITDCDSIPYRLMSWRVKDSSNIVFICEKDGEERLINIPKNLWCAYSQNSEEKLTILKSGTLGFFNKSVLYPLNDGMIIWSEDEASLIQPNGTYLWKVSNISHPTKNRFILYGKFSDEKKQIALISSNLVIGIKVTLLDPSDGNIMKSITLSNSEATQIIYVEGKKRDYILMLLNKPDSNIVTTALTQINDLSTTIVNLVSNEEVNNTVQSIKSEELGLLDLDESIPSVSSITDFKDEANKPYRRSIAVSVTSNKDTSVLNIYILSTFVNPQMKTTEVRKIDFRNWDKSIKARCKI